MLWPWRNENVVGGGVEIGALLAFAVFVLVVGFQIWAMWTPIKNFFGIGGAATAAPRITVNQQNEPGPGLDLVAGGVIDEQQNLVSPVPAEAPALENVNEVPVDPVPVHDQHAGQELDDEQVIGTGEGNQNDGGQTGLEGVGNGQLMLARFSNYWPPYGGLNCDLDCSTLASGADWAELLNWGTKIAACPDHFPFGTRFEWPVGTGVVWLCLDRGGSITYGPDGSWFWLDFLLEYATVDYGAFIWVKVLDPQD